MTGENEIQAAFAEVEISFFGETALVNGKQVNGIFSNVNVMETMMQGGYQGGSDLTFRATKTQFASVPVQRGTLIRNKDGTKWQWSKVSVDEVAHYVFNIKRML